MGRCKFLENLHPGIHAYEVISRLLEYQQKLWRLAKKIPSTMNVRFEGLHSFYCAPINVKRTVILSGCFGCEACSVLFIVQERLYFHLRV